MNIKVQDVLSSIKNYLIEIPNQLMNSTLICKKITSMYQDIDNQTIFVLKSSKNISYYAKKANDRKPILMIIDSDPYLFENFHFDVPVVYVNDFPEVANILLKLFYGQTTERLKFIAVTGTNGKTTTCHMISQLLGRLGKKAAIIGTLGVYDSDYQKRTFNHTTQTTPMYFEMGEIIDYFDSENYDYIVYEATSIALDQRRIDFIKNELSIFTNFSPEHLEYHGTLTHYLNSKLRLNELSQLNLVNLDTPEYLSLTDDTFHYSNQEKSYYQYHINNDRLDIVIDDNSFSITPAFYGRHNYINLPVSIFALHKLGFNTDDIIKASNFIKAPENRFQIVSIDEYTVILDFAHTALAVNESILDALYYTKRYGKKLNAMVTGIGLRGFEKIGFTVNGIPSGVNKLVLTAEQVGNEQPEKIIKYMLEHLPPYYNSNDVVTAHSRKNGLEEIIRMTNKNDDVILLTGINEPQNYRKKKYDHDDRAFIESLLK